MTQIRLGKNGSIRTGEHSGACKYIKLTRYDQTMTIKKYNNHSNDYVIGWYDHEHDREMEIHITADCVEDFTKSFGEFFYDIQYEQDQEMEA